VQGDPCWAADKLRDYFAQRLAREGARNVTVDGEQIRFDGRMGTFDPVKWHFLHMISSGTVTVSYRDNRVGVVCRISFIAYFVIFLLMMGWTALVTFGFARSPLLQGLGMFTLAFCLFGLIIGGPIAINCYRFNRFMQHRLREFLNSASSLGVQGELIVSR
jgi:hypothetical protein